MNLKPLLCLECYDYLTVDPAELSEIDKDTAYKVHRKGQLHAVHKASENLFIQMKQKGGTDAALEYLRQRGTTFSEEAQVSGSGFSFNISMDES